MHCTYDTLPNHRCESSRRAAKEGRKEETRQFRGKDARERERKGRDATHRPPRLTTRANLWLLVHQLLDLGELLLLLPLKQKVEHFGFLEERERFGLRGLFVEGGVDLESGLREAKSEESELGIDRKEENRRETNLSKVLVEMLRSVDESILEFVLVAEGSGSHLT